MARPTWDHPDADPLADLTDMARALEAQEGRRPEFYTLFASSQRSADVFAELLGPDPRTFDGTPIKIGIA